MPGELKLGDLIAGRFRIEKLVAEGGMASIFSAYDEAEDRRVAVKMLYPYYKDNATVRARFLEEGRIQTYLTHPNIVRVYEFLEEPVLAIVMEFFDGKTLDEYIQGRGPLDQGKVLAFLLPVLSAIGCAHSSGIIHRDIKPSNILVKEGEPDVIKVMDFGVAKVKDGQRDLTATGTTVGTLHYMSPEQIIGSKQIDGRADIYSLGVTIYKLVTGEVPFNAPTEFALMMAQVEATPMPPSTLRPDISQELEQIILKAMAKRPSDRFQTIKEFTAALVGMDMAGRGDSITETLGELESLGLLKVAMAADEVVQGPTDDVYLGPTSKLSDRDQARLDELLRQKFETHSETLERAVAEVETIELNHSRINLMIEDAVEALREFDKLSTEAGSSLASFEETVANAIKETENAAEDTVIETFSAEVYSITEDDIDTIAVEVPSRGKSAVGLRPRSDRPRSLESYGEKGLDHFDGAASQAQVGRAERPPLQRPAAGKPSQPGSWRERERAQGIPIASSSENQDLLVTTDMRRPVTPVKRSGGADGGGKRAASQPFRPPKRPPVALAGSDDKTREVRKESQVVQQPYKRGPRDHVRVPGKPLEYRPVPIQEMSTLHQEEHLDNAAFADVESEMERAESEDRGLSWRLTAVVIVATGLVIICLVLLLMRL
jgi:serine/threonine protein kinase